MIPFCSLVFVVQVQAACFLKANLQRVEFLALTKFEKKNDLRFFGIAHAPGKQQKGNSHLMIHLVI